MATYAEKLKDPRWQKKRLEILSRDKFTCLLCDSTEKTLHVHHGYYERGLEPWEYSDDTLWTVCEACHETLSNFAKRQAFLVGSLPPKLVAKFFMVTVPLVSALRKERDGQ